MPNIPIPAPAEAIFKLRFHQVAIYHHDPEAAVEFWEAAGFQNWIKDECLLRGTENDEPFEMREREYFNYDILQVVEFCYFQYSTGVYRENDGRNGNPPFMALMAAYVDNLEEQIQRIGMELGLHPFRLYDSIEHENPYLVSTGMRFHKALYDTTDWLGFDVKLTQKVMPGDANYPQLTAEAVLA